MPNRIVIPSLVLINDGEIAAHHQQSGKRTFYGKVEAKVGIHNMTGSLVHPWNDIVLFTSPGKGSQ